MRRRLIPLLLVIACLQGCSKPSTTTPPSQAPTTTPTTAAPTTAPAGSLALPARWWIWTESFPPDRNPIDDPAGTACAQNQPADVWFLAGTHGGTATRQCDIPTQRPIYFPVLNQICSADGDSSPEVALDACSFEPDEVAASLDGQRLAIKKDTSADIFTFDAQRDSSTGFAEGPNAAVSWGYWVGPITVPAGRHVLRFHGSDDGFELDVTYALQVA